MEDNNELIIPELNKETIQGMIYEIRGLKVMLDFDLARIYGYETKRSNEQVKNNMEKFEQDFMFKINKDEWNDALRSKKSATKNGLKRRTMPFAFTESGIYMVMTVLKGELATKQTIASIDEIKRKEK